jgi:hypothetical protein
MAQRTQAANDNAPCTEVGALASQPRARRGVHTVKTALRAVRNLLAILGFIFLWLLCIGYMQYQDRAAAGDLGCTFTHCA